MKKKPGLTTDVLDAEGKVVGEIDLPKEIFAAQINEKLLAQAVRVYLANQRQGTVSTKTRGEVAGSTRKIYRQKGTGRARHGSRKAPIFVGGGIIFGPKPRDFSLKFPKKMKKAAFLSALASKFKDKDILVVSGLAKLKPKTAEMIKTLKSLKIAMDDGKLTFPTLLVTTGDQENLVLACRNIQNLFLSPFNLLHPYLLLSHQKIIFSKEAIEKFSDLWKPAKS
ncbi:50S ribosomal protein L4 [Candidatus Gottesmanbacteria bacterium]|nr:50S ribosomal protein L4 [Candidatus Gottesmanbacteria bacterium]